MPKSQIQTPACTDFAHTLIERLRRHHGVARHSDEDLTPSELDELFAKFDAGKGIDCFAQDASVSSGTVPSRHVPARQVLIAIRLAASLKSPSVIDAAQTCGALTVIRDIDLADLATLKDVLRICYAQDQWQVIAPDVAEGALIKNAQARFHTALSDSFDMIQPVLALQADGISLPKHLIAMVSPTLPTFPMARISGDILTIFLQSGHLSHHITDPNALRAALPSDEILSDLNTVTACATLRATNLQDALAQLSAVTKRDAQSSGPHLEDMSGDSPALSAARRIVDDLRLWKDGKASWDEISRSILFDGPPGTGKTYLASAIGNSAGLSVVNASFGAWQSAGHLGDMLREMRGSFAEARRKAPCVLIIDEIDAVGSRSDDDSHGSGYRLQVINAFLAELDAISRDEGVILVGTTNRADKIDPAVLRAGRMDLKVAVPLPDTESLLAILRQNLRDEVSETDLQALARGSVGKSAAEIDAAIRAARSDARHSDSMLSLAMLQDHLNIDASAENQNLLWRIAVHEAGHAIIAAALNLGPVTSLRVSPDGGQVTCQFKPNESLLSDFEAQIAYSLAGRAAERLVLGDISAGAGGSETSDLALATKAAIQIETTLGLGEGGALWHAKPNEALRATTRLRARLRHRLDHAEQRATTLLTEYRDQLEALARELLHQRSMRAAEIEPWLRDVTPMTAKPQPSTQITAPHQLQREPPRLG
ncbi:MULTISPECIES: AAA family ATPase [Pacificibacter]|uniref:AAA family ATPase n=1 Tax=Pacificibacter TaxID=1042323 RepID=UPI001C094155|nr:MULTISPECIES: AAA family ATPase [Pacificibacter]MBU2935131.1 AAA family ATPase [Pacificibacter marinus]MDO6615923.1 AAA family ATPase [Pacificibacter sp. 1_MG-2023]